LLNDTEEHRALLTGIFEKRLADGRGETLFEIGYDGERTHRSFPNKQRKEWQ